MKKSIITSVNDDIDNPLIKELEKRIIQSKDELKDLIEKLNYESK